MQARQFRPQDDVQERVIIFLHIPKTAGTTLNRIMDWEYHPLRIFSINGRYFRDSYRHLINCPPARVARMRVFRGHMPFGLHNFLAGPFTYITVVREPVARMISEYFFAANRPFHRQHREVKKQSLEEYVRSTPYNNVQTKIIAGRSNAYDFLAGDCTEEMLAAAKDNLNRHFSFVGLTERFEESLALAKIVLGWKVSSYTSFRITPRRPDNESIPAATREFIAHCNSMDVALYEHAADLFEKAVTKNKERVAVELEAVRRARLVNRAELVGYRLLSIAVKNLTLINSAIRCIASHPTR